MLTYEPLYNVLQAATEARVEAASRMLIHALAGQSAHLALARLKDSGVIGEDVAAHLALELNDQLVQGSQPVEKRIAQELPAGTEPKELPEPKSKPKAKHKRSVDADVARFCPICLEEGVQTRLSIGSCGCVKHWREVKRREKSQGEKSRR